MLASRLIVDMEKDGPDVQKIQPYRQQETPYCGARCWMMCLRYCPRGRDLRAYQREHNEKESPPLPVSLLPKQLQE